MSTYGDNLHVVQEAAKRAAAKKRVREFLAAWKEDLDENEIISVKDITLTVADLEALIK